MKTAYFDKPQTTRYYIGTHRTDTKDICQIYTYLTPLVSHRLSNFEKLKEEQCQYNKEKKRKNKIRILREDDHFVQINYQDILDGIVIPLLSSPSLTTRNRFFLEEFKNFQISKISMNSLVLQLVKRLLIPLQNYGGNIET